ncbi:hypothetical protein HDU96_003147 [Phlyctochytrium bullatum]|nr:hypothetical protein HDU96_003147 [Phlyctochytrium bullatum]
MTIMVPPLAALRLAPLLLLALIHVHPSNAVYLPRRQIAAGAGSRPPRPSDYDLMAFQTTTPNVTGNCRSGVYNFDMERTFVIPPGGITNIYPPVYPGIDVRDYDFTIDYTPQNAKNTQSIGLPTEFSGRHLNFTLASNQSHHYFVRGIDDQIVRQYNFNESLQNGTYFYPSRPSLVQIGVWDGGSADEKGVSDWAGGPVPWGNRTVFEAQYGPMEVLCYDPRGNPVRFWPPLPDKVPTGGSDAGAAAGGSAAGSATADAGASSNAGTTSTVADASSPAGPTNVARSD